MTNTDKTQEDKCARQTLGPLLVVITALIFLTIILAFYYADDIRQSQAGRSEMQLGRFKVPGQIRPGAKGKVKPMALVPPWHGAQNPNAVTGATPQPMSFTQAIGIVSPSVVSIKTSGAQSQTASGIIVHRRGYVLTNNHVINGATNIVVTISSGQLTKSYQARIFDSRPDLDLAIIKIDSNGQQGFVPAPLGDSGTAYIGQQVVAIGNPFDLTQSASSGMVSNANRTLTTGNKTFDDLIQTDASINPGSSGGALINTQGEVIGVNTAIYSSTQSFSGISFAVPINQAKMAFPDLIEIVPSPVGGMTARAGQLNAIQPVGGLNLQFMAAKTTSQSQCWLGVSGYPVNNIRAKEMDLPIRYGVLVNQVFANSPASKVGLMKDDVIYRVDNKRVKDENMLWSILVAKKPGDVIEVDLFRNNIKETVFTTLASPGAAASFSRVPSRSGNLLSPRQQNAAGKQFIEGHWLGLEVIPLTAALASQYQIPQGEPGVLVDEVTLESAESGILAGDIVQSIGGIATPDLEAFFAATQRERVWESRLTNVGISRRGRKMTYVMTAKNATMLGFAQMEAAQPIQPGALRPHRYMGKCTDCHIFMQTGGQLAIDAGDILPSPPPIARNAIPTHRDRGQCATCHTVQSAGAGGRVANANIKAPPIRKNAIRLHGNRGRCVSCHVIR